MQSRTLKNIFISVILISLATSLFIFMYIGCSIERKDKSTDEASGIYIFHSFNGRYLLSLDVQDTDLPEDCELVKEIVEFYGVTVNSEEMTLPAVSDLSLFSEETDWIRDSGEAGDIGGERWKLDDDDISLYLTFNSDGTFELEGRDLECDDNSSSSDDEKKIENVDGTWYLTFKNSADDEVFYQKYFLLETFDDDTFTLEEDAEYNIDDDNEIWAGNSILNTYTDFSREEFVEYNDESYGGHLSVKLTLKMIDETNLTGTLVRTWDFDSSEKEDETENYTVSGVKSRKYRVPIVRNGQS